MTMQVEFAKRVSAWVNETYKASDHAYIEKVKRSKLGTNEKGTQFAADIESYLRPFRTSLNGARVLDIGCGLGGLLVAASRRRAAYCEGWEIQDDRIRLARMNLDIHAPKGSTWRIERQGIDDPELLKMSRQSFDIITSDQVLEHVKDIHLTAYAISSLLHQDGVGVMRCPNGYSINSVIRDQHLLVFGLSLLHRCEAASIARALTGTEDYDDNMGTYLSWEEYDLLFRRTGLDSTLHATIPRARSVERQLRDGLRRINDTMSMKLQEWAAVLDRNMINLIKRRLAAYCSMIERDLKKLSSARWRTKQEFSATLARRYLVDQYRFTLSHATTASHSAGQSPFSESTGQLHNSPPKQSRLSGIGDTSRVP